MSDLDDLGEEIDIRETRRAALAISEEIVIGARASPAISVEVVLVARAEVNV